MPGILILPFLNIRILYTLFVLTNDYISKYIDEFISFLVDYLENVDIILGLLFVGFQTSSILNFLDLIHFSYLGIYLLLISL